MRNYLLLSALSTLLVLGSCKKQDDSIKPSNQKKSISSTSNVVMPYDSCETIIENFYAGQNILVGSINVTNDDVNLYVTFNTEGAWQMSKTHLYVGTLKGMPVNQSGNPQIGKFPYSTTFDPMVISYTFTIPLVELPADDCLVVAAHAEVNKIGTDGQTLETQTAWGDGIQIKNGGSWASYFYYCVCRNSSQVEG
jgi:hypothetical protein